MESKAENLAKASFVWRNLPQKMKIPGFLNPTSNAL
jgi:hypothetical protein